jgi:hypothetical protein
MQKIEEFIENPGSNDIPVKNVFTEEMFSSLEGRMNAIGWPNVRSYWENDFRNRLIVSGFMKDEGLGSKRLASMPDRITNTINVVGSEEPICRPTVINMYDGDLSTTAKWWNAWEKFMFDDALTIKSRDGEMTKKPYEMLQGIKKAKYPAISEVSAYEPGFLYFATKVVTMDEYSNIPKISILLARRKGFASTSNHVWSNFRFYPCPYDEYSLEP